MIFILSISQFALASPYSELAVRGSINNPFKGEATLPTTGDFTSKNDMSGGEVGVRGGWQFERFGFGLEVTLGAYQQDDPDSTEGNAFGTTDGGLYFRYESGRKHINLTFLASAAKDEVLSKANLNDTVRGFGTRVGYGYRIFKKVALNVDYLIMNYDEADDETITKYDFDRNAIMFGFTIWENEWKDWLK